MIALPMMPAISILALALGLSSAAPNAPTSAATKNPVRPGTTVAKATQAATLEPAPPTFVDATAVFAFAEGAVYHVYTAPERITDIVLQPGEQLGSDAVGDPRAG